MIADEHLDDMTFVLTKALSLSPAQADTAREALEVAWSNKIAAVWSVQEVISIGRTRFDKTLTPEQAQDVLFQANAGYDANIGLTIDGIADAIEQLGFNA